MKLIILLFLIGIFIIFGFVFESYLILYLLLTICSYLWFVLVFISIYRLHQKRGIPYQPQFKEKYYGEIPKMRKPEHLGYLLEGKINVSHLTASIMELINAEVILVKPYQKTYFLEFNPRYEGELLKSELFLLTWLFKRIGNGEKVSIGDIIIDAEKNSGYFWNCYCEWFELATFAGERECFYESKRDILEEAFGYFGLSLILIMENVMIHNNYFLVMGMITVAFLAISYVFNLRRRTEEANEEYYQWLAFGRYLEINAVQSNIMDEKQLANLIIYAKLLNKSKEYREVLLTSKIEISNSLLELEIKGILAVINMKIEKVVKRAKLKARFFSRNRGSTATRSYRKR